MEEIAKLNTVEKEIRISPALRENFLIGLQSLSKLYEAVAFNALFRLEEQRQFKKEGVVPEAWITAILKMEQGEDFLKRQRQNNSDQASNFPAEKEKPAQPKRKRRRAKENELVPRELTDLALDKIKEMLALSTYTAVGELLGVNISTIKGKGNARLHIKHLDNLVLARSLDRTDFFTKIGLSGLLASADETQKRSAEDPGDRKEPATTEAIKNDKLSIVEIFTLAAFQTGFFATKQADANIQKGFFLGYFEAMLSLDFKNFKIDLSADGETVYIQNGMSKGEFSIKCLPFK